MTPWRTLFGFVKVAATSSRPTHWLGISALIGAVEAQP